MTANFVVDTSTAIVTYITIDVQTMDASAIGECVCGLTFVCNTHRIAIGNC